MEFVFNSELRRQFDNGHVDANVSKACSHELRSAKAALELDALAYSVKKHLDRFERRVVEVTEDPELLQRVSVSAGTGRNAAVPGQLVETAKHLRPVARRSSARNAKPRRRKIQGLGRTFLTLGAATRISSSRKVNVSCKFRAPLTGCNSTSTSAFVDALALVPYMHELGISHIYASPLFKAVPHSVHGYDVCDFNQLNPGTWNRSRFGQAGGRAAREKHGIGARHRSQSHGHRVA